MQELLSEIINRIETSIKTVQWSIMVLKLKLKLSR